MVSLVIEEMVERRGESLFVPAIIKGLGTTFRHLMGNAGRDGKNKDNIWVVQYPEEKRDDRDVLEGGQERSTFRGVHRLNRDEDGRVVAECVDTGCVTGGALTAVRIGDGARVSVPAGG